MQNFPRQRGMQPPKLVNIYKFRLKMGLKFSISSSPNAKFSLASGRATPKINLYTYTFRLK